MTYEELEFAVFCIEEFAAKNHMTGREAYSLLEDKTKMISEYIVPNYEILHSMGKEAILDELTAVLKERGEKLC